MLLHCQLLFTFYTALYKKKPHYKKIQIHEKLFFLNLTKQRGEQMGRNSNEGWEGGPKLAIIVHLFSFTARKKTRKAKQSPNVGCYKKTERKRKSIHFCWDCVQRQNVGERHKNDMDQLSWVNSGLQSQRKWRRREQLVACFTMWPSCLPPGHRNTQTGPSELGTGWGLTQSSLAVSIWLTTPTPSIAGWDFLNSNLNKGMQEFGL